MSIQHECDACGKKRRDIQACGRDSNGEPDAPDLCFVCRVEWQKGRVFCRTSGRYIHQTWDPHIGTFVAYKEGDLWDDRTEPYGFCVQDGRLVAQ